MIGAFWTGSFHGLAVVWKSDMGPGLLVGSWFWHFCGPECFCQKR